MKANQLNQLLNQSRELEFETQLNYEVNVRIDQLRTLMRIYKKKNRELYKYLNREYLELIR
jgi:DNA repair ATPase RecN